MAMQVPQPAEATWKSVHALEESLNKYLTEFEMETFKTATRLIAKEHFGDVLRPLEDYTPSEWSSFVELVHARCNSIERFVDAWPLRAYYRLYRKKHRSDTNKEQPSTPSHERQWPIPPSPRGPCPNNSNNVGSPVRHRKSKAPPSKRPYRPRPITLPTPPSTPPTSAGALYSLVLACPACAFLPAIPSRDTVQLDRLTDKLDHARHIFRLNGISNDLQVECMKHWPEVGQGELLEALVKNGLAPIDKALIWKRLQLLTRRLPSPSPDEERCATEPGSSYSTLQRLMKLDKTESLQKIICVFEMLWKENKDITHLDRKRWKKFVERGCEAYPGLVQYAEAWPLKVLLKRKVVIRPGNKQELPKVRHDWIHFLPLHYQPSAELPPRLAWVACPMHGCAVDLENCDSHIRGLLKTYGCEELLPWLLRAGVRTKESWERFYGLERGEKMVLLENIQGFNLTLFQRHLLARLVSLL